ncbi:MAG: hypothetical protein SP1CHLAM54_10980 [Chlamydiia bacterium]|nr:hypothetical protein [Chlamydiia bacterium]MCH9616003.1 hypothetical protein [Chlamydiia bacterium]MCH9629026.1 hypothetical protein [Chlamydiia bacterium]
MLNSITFHLASYLTEPFCLAHEYYWRMQVEDALHCDPNRLTVVVKKIQTLTGMIFWGILAFFTTVPGILLRMGAAFASTSTYIEVQRDQEDMVLPPDRSFSLLSWNVCVVPAGLTITDGGVVPWRDRLQSLIGAIGRENADLVCLQEVFDARAGSEIADGLLQRGYKYCYYNFGAHGIGPASGLFVASKYRIENLNFTHFPRESMVGRTQLFCIKGVLEFDMKSGDECFARVLTTHPQHSEEPEFPIAEEAIGRTAQMGVIMERVNQVRDRCLLLTGDLNLSTAEFNGSPLSQNFERGRGVSGDTITWRGDEFCANLTEQQVSGPLTLDYTLARRGTVRSLDTRLVETHYDPTVYSPHALSDHEGLFSRVTLLPAH